MKILLTSLLVLLSGPSAAQELVMFEERGCYWCAQWNADIGGVYSKTKEGQMAPLRRQDIHAAQPDDLSDIKPVTYTPTFVLVHEGREVGRIEGYPGEDFFWGLLGRMLKEIGMEVEG